MVQASNFLARGLRNIPELQAGLVAGGAPAMWERVILEALPTIRGLVPQKARILEVGYGNGLLTCYLAHELGWRVVGLEVDKEAQHQAREHARQHGLTERLEFRCDEPEEIFTHRDQYDAVFVKTVLYQSKTLEEYGRWLDWILSVLCPAGVLIDFETGRSNSLTQFYRRLRRRNYTDLCLYTGEVEALFDARFEIIERRYYGGLSQFLAPMPMLYHLAAGIEEAVRPRNADNCFIASIIARRRDSL